MVKSVLLSLFAVAGLQAQTAEDFFRAIRAGDNATLRTLCKNPVNVKDRLDTTPLHYAALYGTPESVEILLEHGADPKARNKSDATPLIYAAYNFDKTRLLVEKGAEVNGSAAKGMTPLLIAVSVHGNTKTVRYLIRKGANVNAEGPNGSDALQIAAFKSDADTVSVLLKSGADCHKKDSAGFTALMNAFGTNEDERIKLLLDAGSDVHATNTFAGMVKNGPIALTNQTVIINAAPDYSPTIVKALLTAGARANDADVRKITPLMLAVATDNPKLDNIRYLLAAHADVNAKDLNGETALDWALKFRNPTVLALLKEAGAKTAVMATLPVHPADFVPFAPKDSVARASDLLAKAGDTFFVEGGGCVGCHHQPLNARAFAALRASNSHPEERLRKEFMDAMVANRPFILTNLPLLSARGGDFDEYLAQTQALADLGEPASPSTDAMLHYLAARQNPGGDWNILGGPRPPLESSNITRTAAAIRAFKTYGWPARREEFEERIARAEKFLLSAKPTTSYEAAERIMGLKAAGASQTEISKATRNLLDQQHPDGGWAQNSYLDSDAYATGMVLANLYQYGGLKASDPAYTKGVAFLLKTQFPDGSWYVRSRAPKLQPYFQSAFPYDHDQWISTSATAVAVMALAPALQ